MMIHSANDTLPRHSIHLPDEAATLALGAAIARNLAPGLVIYLHGNLGAGKTTLSRGILRGLGFTGKVK
ncbi:MAG: tRNA (adenosine(37)-N6)-threonylcarbamoyltransferase complex ATPase subunit type 1 TsaE, partial [Sulfuriferula sp.]